MRLTTILLGLAFAASATAQQSVIHYLSGRGVDDTKTWNFRCSEGRNSGQWGKIEVPSNWELQGYGEYTYGRYYYGNKNAKPSMEKGEYRTTFSAPKEWEGQRVLIWFDGVMTDTEVRVNGQLAPIVPAYGAPAEAPRYRHHGGFYRFAVDATGLTRSGKNQLEVHVWKHSEDNSVNAAERKADWWLFGGIYRPVWLEVRPQEAIAGVMVDAQGDGQVRLQVQLDGSVEGYAIEAEVAGTSFRQTVKQLKRGEAFPVAFSVKNALTWDPEHPNLYDLRLTLRNAAGQAVHEVTRRIGFRTIEFRPKDGIYLNGTKLVVKGINRHSFWPEGGRATSEALSIEDARLIKAMNMNGVRSHYPPDEHFLNACDSLGLLYIDELAGWQNAVNDSIGHRIVPEMVARDQHHPSIYIWANGNEGGFNYSVDQLFADIDIQQRPVIHPWADWKGLDTHHYPTYLTGVARFNYGSNVFMPTEFMHACYDQGGGAGLKDFWERWKQSPLFAGGYIWVFSDESVVRTDRGGLLDSDRSNAPDGVVGPHREKSGSFWAIREVWSPIQIEPFRITDSFDGNIYVKNDYMFTNLKGGKLVANGRETILPDIEPGETRRVRLTGLESLQESDFLEIIAIAPQGDTLCTTSYPVHTPAAYFALHQPKGKHGDVKVEFDKTNGQIARITHAGREIPFANGPVAVGMKMKFNAEKSQSRIEKDALGRDVEVFVARYQGGVDSIVWKLDADGRLWMDAVMLNRANGGGGFDDAFMDPNVKYLGLTFSYPEEECTGMDWIGRGPFRVWKNRIPGTNFGRWHKAFNNTITGEPTDTLWQDQRYAEGVTPVGTRVKMLDYPEFKGYHANLYYARLENRKEIRPATKRQAAEVEDRGFSVWCQSENIYFRVFTPEEPSGRGGGKATMPSFPEGDLSFLLDIPAIQSFKPIEQQGPQSQPGNIRIKLGDEGLRIRLMFEF